MPHLRIPFVSYFTCIKYAASLSLTLPLPLSLSLYLCADEKAQKLQFICMFFCIVIKKAARIAQKVALIMFRCRLRRNASRLSLKSFDNAFPWIYMHFI